MNQLVLIEQITRCHLLPTNTFQPQCRIDPNLRMTSPFWAVESSIMTFLKTHPVLFMYKILRTALLAWHAKVQLVLYWRQDGHVLWLILIL